MRRFNKDRSHREGYRWLRFQESKPLSAFTIALFLSLVYPFLFDFNVSVVTYAAHAIITAGVMRYSLCEISIAVDDDGIYLEVNKKRLRKIRGWEDPEIKFKAVKIDNKRFLKKESIVAYTHHGSEKEVYVTLCRKMNTFFQSACEELSKTHERKIRRRIN